MGTVPSSINQVSATGELSSAEHRYDTCTVHAKTSATGQQINTPRRHKKVGASQLVGPLRHYISPLARQNARSRSIGAARHTSSPSLDTR